jgi:hypothetical protein
MSTRRLRWRGLAQTRRIESELQRQLSAWLQGWSVEAQWLTLAAGEASPVVAGAQRWLRARAGGNTAWIGAPAQQMARLGDRLAGVAVHERSDLGERIGRRALRALLAQWLACDAERIAFEEEAPAPEDLQARFGGARFQLQGQGFSALLVVDAGLCDQLAPTSTPKLPALEPRASALGEAQVEFQVRLALGETTLSEAHALQVGDVLVSGTRVDACFELVHPDARVVAEGRLRRHEGRLAFAPQSANPTSRKQA